MERVINPDSQAGKIWTDYPGLPIVSVATNLPRSGAEGKEDSLSGGGVGVYKCQ